MTGQLEEMFLNLNGTSSRASSEEIAPTTGPPTSIAGYSVPPAPDRQPEPAFEGPQAVQHSDDIDFNIAEEYPVINRHRSDSYLSAATPAHDAWYVGMVLVALLNF